MPALASKTDVQVSSMKSADTTESININGQEMTGQSKEKVTVQIVDDKPKITKVVAFTSM